MDLMTTSMRMEKRWNHVNERILDLTLEIIYLLTGEDYKVVKKKSGDPLSPRSRLHRTSPITVPPPHCQTTEGKSGKRILKVTNKIIDLLTEEVPIRCQDVTVHFSMEEWEYLEGHKDLYKDVMMENQPPLTSPDGSSNGNPPERCPHPLDSWDSTQEEHEIPHPHQGKDLIDMKVEIKEEEEVMLVGDQQSMEEGEMIMTTKQEESSQDIGTDGRYVGNLSQGGPILSQYYNDENNGIRQNSPGLNPITQNLPRRPYCFETSNYLPNPKETSGNTDTLTSDINRGFHTADRPKDPSNPKESSPNQEGLHPEESSLSCLGCGKSFRMNSELLIHLRSHTRVTIVCPECGKTFTDKKVFNDHQKIHTGETPFSCSECGKYFTVKGSLQTHQRIHKGERPYSCPECGKCFTQKGHLIRHQKTHPC
ncbi:uncharacterized protein LOC143956329 [Lithobates pipiens]